jgi:hypothetical protein
VSALRLDAASVFPHDGSGWIGAAVPARKRNQFPGNRRGLRAQLVKIGASREAMQTKTLMCDHVF